jgi:hypothetical protein
MGWREIGMKSDAFVEANVYFTEPAVAVGDEIIEERDNPFFAQLDGPWVHLVRGDAKGPHTATVYTLPSSSIKAISWVLGFVRPPSTPPPQAEV